MLSFIVFNVSVSILERLSKPFVDKKGNTSCIGECLQYRVLQKTVVDGNKNKGVAYVYDTFEAFEYTVDELFDFFCLPFVMMLGDKIVYLHHIELEFNRLTSGPDQCRNCSILYTTENFGMPIIYGDSRISSRPDPKIRENKFTGIYTQNTGSYNSVSNDITKALIKQLSFEAKRPYGVEKMDVVREFEKIHFVATQTMLKNHYVFCGSKLYVFDADMFLLNTYALSMQQQLVVVNSPRGKWIDNLFKTFNQTMLDKK